MKYKNDEINYLLIFKILLKEKWIILFITLLFLFSSGLYNFTKKSTYNLDLSINLGKYSELEVDCDSYQATGSLIFCESKIPASFAISLRCLLILDSGSFGNTSSLSSL